MRGKKITPRVTKKRWQAMVEHAQYRSVPGVRIHQVVLDADLRLMLPGLLNLCTKLKLRVAEKEKGQLIVFINTKRDYLKVIACNQSKNPVLACYRVSRGRIYDLSIVQEIPSCFRSDGSIDLDEALARAIEKKLGRKQRGRQ